MRAAQASVARLSALRANLYDIGTNCRGRIRIGVSRLRAFCMSRELLKNVLSLVYRKNDPMPQLARDFIRMVQYVFTVYGRLLDLEAQSCGGES